MLPTCISIPSVNAQKEAGSFPVLRSGFEILDIIS